MTKNPEFKQYLKISLELLSSDEKTPNGAVVPVKTGLENLDNILAELARSIGVCLSFAEFELKSNPGVLNSVTLSLKNYISLVSYILDKNAISSAESILSENKTLHSIVMEASINLLTEIIAIKNALIEGYTETVKSNYKSQHTDIYS